MFSDIKARHLSIPDGEVVYMYKTPSYKEGPVIRFIRNFDGPYLVTSHPFNRPDMLTFKHMATGETVPHPVNIEKVVVIPEPEMHDLQASNDSVVPLHCRIPQLPPLSLFQVAYQFGKFLQSLPSKSATASQAYKFVYDHFPSSREIMPIPLA